MIAVIFVKFSKLFYFESHNPFFAENGCGKWQPTKGTAKPNAMGTKK